MLGGQMITGAAERTFHVFGSSVRSGSLLPENENDAQAYRDVHLLAACRPQDAGWSTMATSRFQLSSTSFHSAH
jgi:hypothetical protein